MNPIELGQGTFPLSEAATDRFAIMVNIGFLPPDEEEKLEKIETDYVKDSSSESEEEEEVKPKKKVVRKKKTSD